MDQAHGSVGEIELLYRQHGPALLLFALAGFDETFSSLEPSPAARPARIA